MPDTPTVAPISQQHAEDIALHSQLDGPISPLDNTQRGLLFAELSLLAYLPELEAKRAVARLGFSDVLFHNEDGAQAYSFISEHDHVIACRGTEPNEWNDLQADLNATSVVIEELGQVLGRVHRGFKKEVDDLWPDLEKALANNTKTLWFTGHSLGGAMATICAGRCQLSKAISSRPEQIHTFGSPRVGNKRYINHVKVDYLRWVNNNDIVTRVPPVWMGYRHTGEERYFNADGDLIRLNAQQRSRDMWRGFVQGLRTGELDHFSDHAIQRYVNYLLRAVQQAHP